MECPLCQTKHPLLVRGVVRDLENNDLMTEVRDRGYAFCNCRNIFFTDWSNIDKRIYDEAYFDKYQYNGSKDIYMEYVKKYFPIISEHKNIKTFCEIGAINNTLLDVGKGKFDWETIRLDINSSSKDSTHRIITGDIEDDDIVSKLNNIDCIWMSHLVEHLKDPIQTLKNVRDCLSEKGLVFIAMPDPYFIDWDASSQWGHWSLREHHIMWDMESFIELMAELGFGIIFKKRNLLSGKFICCMDYHLIFMKNGYGSPK